MNESINTSFLIGMIAAFITIISLLMITFFSYSRAFKTKNKMVFKSELLSIFFKLVK